VAGTLGLCLIGQLTFHEYQTHLALFPDTQGILAAFVINLIMSVLFVRLYFERSADLAGLSYPAAWAKMLGTGLISLANALVYFRGTSSSFDLRFRPLDGDQWYDGGTVGGTSYHPGFVFYLFAVILIFDVLYLALLARRRRQIAARRAQGVAGAARAATA
jgi:hypothetical protein